ncbi:MAG: hypothetical protein ACREMQ_19085, partial [Longimicrobiales bacterium]
MRLRLIGVAFAAVCAVAAVSRAEAQGRVVPPPPPTADTVRAAPGPRYAASGLHRFLTGAGWRDLWVIPIELPVLDIGKFAGGLEPEEEGGNKQSITLHFVDASGKGWVFRSVDKYPEQKLSDAVNGTPVGELIQDHMSSLHPGGALMIPPLLEALGILHVEPVLYVMPDDPRLGKFRETFAGMIGALEPKANEGPDGSPGFAGSRKIHDTEDLFERLEESPTHTVAERELLRGRLLDFIIGDTDRSTDQYRFARFPDPKHRGRYVWRPIPRDRDWAFLRAKGQTARLARATMFPKWVAFGPTHADIDAHVFTGHIVDRRLLTGLDRSAFAEQVSSTTAALTDSVIDEAASRLPDAYPRDHARWVAAAMKARRDSLHAIADDFYLWLASEVDMHATDERDSAEIVRLADGRLEVRLVSRGGTAAATPSDGNESNGNHKVLYYHRVFLPSETREVRIFLHGDGDIAIVRGESDDIAIRVIGGGGDDVLTDFSRSGRVHFYDDHGDNEFIRAAGTHVDTKPWYATKPPEGIRVDMVWAPDWGQRESWGLAADYSDAARVIVGGGRSWTNFGFRRMPYHWRIDARVLYGIDPSAFGAELRGDYRLENSTNSFAALLRWSGFDGFRWYGLGNDTEEISRDLSLVRMDRVSFEPSF